MSNLKNKGILEQLKEANLHKYEPSLMNIDMLNNELMKIHEENMRIEDLRLSDYFARFGIPEIYVLSKEYKIFWRNKPNTFAIYLAEVTEDTYHVLVWNNWKFQLVEEYPWSETKIIEDYITYERAIQILKQYNVEKNESKIS